MWEISFKIINKHYLNLIQKACVIVVVIRTKTVNHVGGYHLIPSSIQPRDLTGYIFAPVVASRTVNFSFGVQESLVKSSVTLIKVSLYSS